MATCARDLISNWIARVIERHPKFFVFDLGGCLDRVSVDHLKVALGSTPEDVISLPRRGRPPGAMGTPATQFVPAMVDVRAGAGGPFQDVQAVQAEEQAQEDQFQ
ncbi:uncharacterized protein LOC131889202 [Tigriopus californicus]|uniref:uncharacterized protein LOC131889202 n=1 Tax=Tigriopus californicus TaxID=6832 RepID=UPI0027DA822F|nr:uncharacterized protein LOC131889202 [Tigriopus californicus]